MFQYNFFKTHLIRWTKNIYVNIHLKPSYRFVCFKLAVLVSNRNAFAIGNIILKTVVNVYKLKFVYNLATFREIRPLRTLLLN